MLPRTDVVIKKHDGSEQRIRLLDFFQAAAQMPIAVSQFVAEIRKAEEEVFKLAEFEDWPVWLGMMWEDASVNSVYEWFMETEVLGSYGVPINAAMDDFDMEVSRNLMRDCVGHDGQAVIPCSSVTCGYYLDDFGPMSTSGLPSWVVCEAKAFGYEDMFYPFLIFNMDGHGGEGCLATATDECMVASSFCVEKVNKLTKRLAERNSDGQFQVLNSAVFSVALNGAVARVYITHAWDENTDYTYTIASFLLEDHEHNKRFRALIQSICKWAFTERLQGIINAIDSIEKSGLRWYPRYE